MEIYVNFQKESWITYIHVERLSALTYCTVRDRLVQIQSLLHVVPSGSASSFCSSELNYAGMLYM